tara:strand:+ start:146 stop:679 length:534 start_codon:yes stop_codon:yes gene_type:complete
MSFKDKLRKKFSLIRKNKYFEVNKKFFLPILKIIKKNKFKNIAIYYPSNYELNTSRLFELLSKNKKLSTLLPYTYNKSIKFVRWNFLQPLKVNRFGFLDPILQKKAITPDLIVVPLLAFDKSKNRLGYGKGYYDKFLSKNKDILTIGVAFSFQKFKKIKTSKLDIKMNSILTEKGIF